MENHWLREEGRLTYQSNVLTAMPEVSMGALWPRSQERFLGPNGGKAKGIQQVSNGAGIPAQDSCALFSYQTSHCLSPSPCVPLGSPASGLCSEKLAHGLEQSGFLCPGLVSRSCHGLGIH